MFEDIISKSQEDKIYNFKSSWIKSFRFKNGTLTMKTLSGKEYTYYEVPRSLWEELKGEGEDGGSIGSFYNEYIKGQYAER